MKRSILMVAVAGLAVGACTRHGFSYDFATQAVANEEQERAQPLSDQHQSAPQRGGQVEQCHRAPPWERDFTQVGSTIPIPIIRSAVMLGMKK